MNLFIFQATYCDSPLEHNQRASENKTFSLKIITYVKFIEYHKVKRLFQLVEALKQFPFLTKSLLSNKKLVKISLLW